LDSQFRIVKTIVLTFPGRGLEMYPSISERRPSLVRNAPEGSKIGTEKHSFRSDRSRNAGGAESSDLLVGFAPVSPKHVRTKTGRAGTVRV